MRFKKLIYNLIAPKDEPTTPDISASSKGDAAMLKRVGLKFVLLFLVISFFEELLEFAMEIIELVLEIIHLLIEFIEQLLEELLEHLLHTDHHQTETIIANGVLILALFSMLLFSRYLPGFYHRTKRNVLATWLKYKKRRYSNWRALSKTQKLKLVLAYCVGFSVLLLWFTL